MATYTDDTADRKAVLEHREDFNPFVPTPLHAVFLTLIQNGIDVRAIIDAAEGHPLFAEIVELWTRGLFFDLHTDGSGRTLH